jgi:hypothetical protein
MQVGMTFAWLFLGSLSLWIVVPTSTAWQPRHSVPHRRSVALHASSTSRARFLASSATGFLVASSFMWSGVMGTPEVCDAADMAVSNNDSNVNPRYVDRELQMQYGQGPGMYCCIQAVWEVKEFGAFLL